MRDICRFLAGLLAFALFLNGPGRAYGAMAAAIGRSARGINAAPIKIAVPGGGTGTPLGNMSPNASLGAALPGVNLLHLTAQPAPSVGPTAAQPLAAVSISEVQAAAIAAPELSVLRKMSPAVRAAAKAQPKKSSGRKSRLGLLFDGMRHQQNNGTDEPAFAGSMGDAKGPKLSHAGRELVHISLLYPGSDAALDKKIALLERDFGFLRDHGHKPHLSSRAAVVSVWGSVLQADWEKLENAPGVLGVDASHVRLENMAAAPPAPGKQESLLQTGMRKLYVKNEWLAVLAMAPYQLGTMAAVFGPFFVGAGTAVPQLVAWSVLGGGAALLLTFTAFQVLLASTPRLRAAIAPLALALAGLAAALSGQAVPGIAAMLSAYGAWRGARGLLLGQNSIDHPADKLAASTAAAALINVIGLGLMGLALAYSSPLWSAGLLGFSLLSALPLSIRAASPPRKAEKPVVEGPSASVTFVQLLDKIRETHRSARRYKFAGYAGLIGGLIAISNGLEAGMFLFALGIAAFLISIGLIRRANGYRIRQDGLVFESNDGALPDGPEHARRLREKLLAGGERLEIIEKIEPAFLKIFGELRSRGASPVEEKMAYLESFFAAVREGERDHFTLPSMAYHLLASSDDIIDAYRAGLWADRSLRAFELAGRDAALTQTLDFLSSYSPSSSRSLREIDFLKGQALSLGQNLENGLNETKAEAVSLRLKQLEGRAGRLGTEELVKQVRIMRGLYADWLDRLRTPSPSPTFVEESSLLIEEGFGQVRALWAKVGA